MFAQEARSWAELATCPNHGDGRMAHVIPRSMLGLGRLDLAPSAPSADTRSNPSTEYPEGGGHR
jgi:hypothetical protein